MCNVTGDREPIFLPSTTSLLGELEHSHTPVMSSFHGGLRNLPSEFLTYNGEGSMTSVGRTLSQSNAKSVVVAATDKAEVSNGETNGIPWPQ